MIKKLITLLVLFICYFGHSQKQEFPQGNEYFHFYEKVGDTISYYDIYGNLVREAYPNKDITANFYKKEILLKHLGSHFSLSNHIISSYKNLEYLTTSIEHRDLIVDENNYIKKNEIDKNTGFGKLIYSSVIDNSPPPPPTDPNRKLTKEELEHIKFDKENKDLIAYQSRLDQSYNKNSQVYSYIKYEQGQKTQELYFKFNEQNLISNTLYIRTLNYNKIERKSISYKTALFDINGNIIELNDTDGGEMITIKDKNENIININTASNDIMISAKRNLTFNAEEYVTINAKNVAINASETIQQVATKSIDISSKNENILLKANKNIENSSENIILEATDTNKITAKDLLHIADGDLILEGGKKAFLRSAKTEVSGTQNTLELP